MQGRRREALAVGLVWLAWLGAILLTVTIGLASGAYTFAQGWSIHDGLWPLFAWDYNWYHFVAYGGYPAGQGGRQYAFFPLWPELLRWSGAIPDVVAAAALAWAASAAAFFGLAEGPPRARLRTALALACWPGSFVLTLAYPDAPRARRGAWAAALALRGRPLTAGLVGAIAAVARPNGVLIALPLAWLARGQGPRAWLGAAAPVAGGGRGRGLLLGTQRQRDGLLRRPAPVGPQGPGGLGHWADHLGACSSATAW